MHKQPIIGLAGGIGSGKSAVAKALADLGCVVADSDAASRAAFDDPEIRRRILDEFGEGVLCARSQKSEVRDQKSSIGSESLTADLRPLTSEIDRSALAKIVFNDPAKRRVLETIIHPWVEKKRVEQFRSAPPDAPALVIDAPLLFEAGLDKVCDAVIFVDAPREVRLARVKQSRGWDEGELDRREKSQRPLDEKRRLADHVISNDGSIEALTEHVRRILATIVQLGRTGDRA